MCGYQSCNNESSMKNYVTKLRFNTMEKRVWFVGQDNEETAQRFKDACIRLNEIGDTCTEWTDFFNKAITHFNQHGFTRIKK